MAKTYIKRDFQTGQITFLSSTEKRNSRYSRVMSSDIELTEMERERKKKKKSKKKSERKKLKKEKKKKTAKKESKTIKSIKDDITKSKYIVPNNETSLFGPALPPHLIGQKVEASKEPIQIIEPIRGEFLENHSFPLKEISQRDDSTGGNVEESLIDTYGPLPVGELSSTQIKLEERALQLKMAAIDGTLVNRNADQNVREEWMLELPEIGLKKGLPSLSNLKRGFYHGKDNPDFSNRTDWTKTPNQNVDFKGEKPCTSKRTSTSDSLKDKAQLLYDKQRDREQEAMAKRHEKKYKRDESLVEMHKKKLRKEQKKKEKEMKESNAKRERRPFSRDLDLKINKIDSNQTKQIVDKAKILDTKFSTGHTKYL
ncbi:GPALPP motifs-containing protein 1 isoform 1-T1 [Glossina fuscipes fuscipes]